MYNEKSESVLLSYDIIGQTLFHCRTGIDSQKRTQRKTYWRRKSESLFSEGVEGAIALFVDFQIVHDKIKTKQMTVADKDIENRLLQSLIFFMF